MFCEDYEAFVKTLTKKGYHVHSAENGQKARETALELIGNGSVGCGGSITVRELKLIEALVSHGNTVYSHWVTPDEDRVKLYRNAMTADFYLCSSNAITKNGTLVNIDGTGNRVASMIAGPLNSVIIIGKNKFVKTKDEAIKRIKAVACPQNGKRLGLDTPCVMGNGCKDCDVPARMCRATTYIEYPPRFIQKMHLILVDEVLGY